MINCLITANQNPDQLNLINAMLVALGWLVQPEKQIGLTAGVDITVCEYQTGIGPANYTTYKQKAILFINSEPTST